MPYKTKEEKNRNTREWYSKPEGKAAIKLRNDKYRNKPETKIKLIQYQKIYRRNHPKKIQEISHKAHYKKKMQVFIHYTQEDGLIRCSCSGCNANNINFLSVGHTNNDGAGHRKMAREQNKDFYSFLIANNYPTDPPLQLECYNCNCGKRSNSGICPLYGQKHN